MKSFATSETATVKNGLNVTIDLNGKTIIVTDNTTKNFEAIKNQGTLTIKDSSADKTGKITVTATTNSGWNRYSAVIANTVGGKLTVEGGTLEHLGGTDMAYGIDNLTNGKGTYAETIINGGTIKSTYRAIRQFLNGTEAQNILTINGGTVEGANKSVWMQDPNTGANTGTLTVGENAKLVGDAYLSVTAGSTEWPVEVSIAATALQGESEVVTSNVPAGYDLAEVDGTYGVYTGAAKIGTAYYATIAKAINAAQAGDVITILRDITENVTINKNVTIDGAGKKYTGTMTGNAGLTVTVQNVNFVNGGFDKSTKSTTGTYTIKDCTFDGAGSYAYAFRFKGANKVVVENCTVKDYLYSFLYVTSGTNTVSVKNVTVENCPSYAVYFSSGVNSATFENLTVKNSNNGFVINNTANRAFTIKDCKMENVTTAINYSDGTSDITCTVLGVNDFGTVALSEYAKLIGATITGTTYYGSVKGMVEKAVTDQTVQLLSDITLDATGYEMASCDGYPSFVHVEGKAITVDLNGKTITADVDADDVSNFVIGVFSTDNGGELTLVDNSAEGTGTVKLEAEEGKAYSLLCNYEDGCKMTINGGTYVANKVRDCLVYSGGKADALVTVNGGNFTLGNVGVGENGKPWIFNVLGAGDHHVLVNGGTFNADINRQHWSNEVYVAKECYTVANTDGTYTVKEGAVAYVNEGMLTGPYFVRKNIGYATLAEAVAEVDNDETVTMLKDITLDETLAITADKKNITLDLNGKTISQTKAQTAGYQMILNDGELTIDDSSEAKTGKISYTDSGNGGEYISDVIYNRATLVINGGTIENLSSATVAQNGYPHAVDTYSGIRNASVTINGGTIHCAEYSAIRMFCVSPTYTADLVINGGNVKGAIDMQNGTKVAALGSLSITGGKFETTKNANNIRFANWNGGATEYGITASISGGDFYGGITTQYVPAVANWNKGIITGGTYASDMTEYCNADYRCVKNSDGRYTVERCVFEIVDGDLTEFHNDKDIENVTITYKRTFSNTLNNAFYVPFEIPVEVLIDNYDIHYINDVHSYDEDNNGTIEKMTMEIIKITNGKLKANYPYIICPKNESAKSMEITLENATLHKTVENTISCSSVFMRFDVTGIYSRKTAGELGNIEDKDICAVGNGNWVFAETADQPLNPFRLYLKMTKLGGSHVVIDNSAEIRIRVAGEKDEVTGIYTPYVSESFAKEGIFDLMGRPVVTPEKGKLYIIDGKKVLY